MRAAIAYGALLCLMLSACAREAHDAANKYETLATSVTHAMMAGDIKPVLDDFARATRAKLTPQTVNAVREKLAPLGDLVNVSEETPSNAPQGVHVFRVHFAQATWHEDFSLDRSDKIVGWHVFPLPPS